ncbi:MAG TPA: HAD family phosphatase [Bacteroidales bacterium]|nr:HAD family phosphatase [Bacteroidales bacterium]
MQDIRNIIFDFGAVIINIDPDAVFRHMMARGIDNLDEMHALLVENHIYHDLETGKITPAEFREAIRDTLKLSLSDDEIDASWNTMILDIPAERISFMNRLKSKYSIFLLSNTNAIHYDYYDKYFRETYDYPSLNSFFTRTWYSYQMGVRKPDPAIFRLALEEGRLEAGQTAFIDDMQINVDAAATLGILPIHLPEGKEIMDLFDEQLLLIR